MELNSKFSNTFQVPFIVTKKSSILKFISKITLKIKTLQFIRNQKYFRNLRIIHPLQYQMLKLKEKMSLNFSIPTWLSLQKIIKKLTLLTISQFENLFQVITNQLQVFLNFKQIQYNLLKKIQINLF